MWRPPAAHAPSRVPGPVHRVAFFDEQRSNRRATWKLTFASVTAVFVMGLALSTILSPILYALALIAVDIVNIFVPLPDARPAVLALGETARSLLVSLAGGSVPRAALLLLLAGSVVVFLPGLLLIGAAWAGLESLFRRAGVGSILLTLGARAPRPWDLEEHQLMNLVEEMAIAGGINAPRVALLDADVANAAVIGSSIDDATIVVSRRILDEFDRDETQAIIAHLVSSVGNGDLRIAFTIMSVYESLGIVLALLHAPFGRDARRALRRLLAVTFATLIGRSDAAKVDLAMDLLTRELKTSTGDRNWQGWRLWLSAPLLFANITVEWILLVFNTWVVSPLLGRLWCARRYLADASAVQLTRNPDALARGLERLADTGAVIPGCASSSHLFIVGPEAAKARFQAEMVREMTRLQVEDQGKAMAERMAHLAVVMQQRRAEDKKRAPATVSSRSETRAALPSDDLAKFHPPLDRRMDRLRALGATVDFPTRPRPRGLQGLVMKVLIGLAYTLLGMAVLAMLTGMVMFIGLSLAFMAVYVLAIHSLLTAVARLR